MENRWVAARESEAAEAAGEAEVRERVRAWSAGRARTASLISKRQESSRYSSQTAALHSRPSSAATRPITPVSDESDVEIIDDIDDGPELLPPEYTSRSPHSSRPASAARPMSARPPSPPRSRTGGSTARLTPYDVCDDDDEQETQMFGTSELHGF